MSKEPGLLAHDLFYQDRPQSWENLPSRYRAEWSRVESAIRADEAAKVRAATIEECAKVADSNDFLSDVSTADCESWIPESAYGQGRLDAAKAIRSLGSK